MRATFCRINENYYRVNFRGRFWKIFPFRYSVTLRVVGESDGTVKLAGSSHLGRLMGTFYYRATVSGTKFSATYSSKKDNGTFTMWRSNCCR